MNAQHVEAATAWSEIVDKANQSALDSVRVVHSMPVGKWGRQGDIYVVAVPASHPRGEALQSRQLAVGVTQGSRHVAEAPSEVYEGTAAPPGWSARFLGPVVVSDRRFLISHPEHADCELPPGTYQIVHQLDAATMARVKD